MTTLMRLCIQALEIISLSRVDGLSVRGRVRSSVIREESLLLHMERFKLWGFLHLIGMVSGSLLDVVFQECPTRSKPPPNKNPGHAGEMISLGRPESTLVFPLMKGWYSPDEQ